MNSIEDIPEYLIKQIDKIANEHGLIKYTIKRDIGSNHADGFVATMLKITITGQNIKTTNSNNDSISLICKILPDNKAHRELFQSTWLFDREVLIYNEILPMFRKFQLERLIPLEKQFTEYPKCYFAIADATTDQYALIMEDLKPIGYDLWNKLKPIDFEHVRLLMIALGKWHGLSFALNDQLPKEFAKFQKLPSLVKHLLTNTTSMGEMFDSSYSRAAELFTANDIERSHLLKFQKSWKQKFLEIFEISSVEPFGILSHGDCWNNNMMFLDKKEMADKMCLIDWQASQLTSPATDLSNYLMTSTTKEFRDQYLTEILEIYYFNLAEMVQLCGSNIDNIFKFNDLKNELIKFGKFGVMMAPLMLTVIVSEPENIVQMDSFSENVHKCDGGDSNGNETKSMATFTEKSQLLYRQRLSDCIRDGVQYGWLEN